MKSHRCKMTVAREIALKLLYEIEMRDDGEVDSGRINEAIARNTGSEVIKKRAQTLIKGYYENKGKIDAAIRESSRKWKIERMNPLDRNLLRVAVYEMLFEPDTPSKVIINEAVEIAKRYCKKNSFKFVNGVLDSIMKKYRPQVDGQK